MQPVQAVPEPDAAAEHDRHLYDVQVVDEVGGQELVDGGRSAAEPYIQVAALWASWSTSAGVPLTKWYVVSPAVSGSRS